MENLPFSCGICSKTFADSTGLAAHMKSHTDVNPYKCGICNQGFLKLSTLTEHIKIHTTDEVFQCHICSCSFQQSNSLKDHLTIHSQSKECSENNIDSTCIASFNNDNICSGKQDCCFSPNEPSNLIPGSEDISNAVMPDQFSIMNTMEFTCTICFKGFTRKILLKNHMKTHANDKLFSCNDSGKAGLVTGNIDQQVDAQMGEKMFECDVCQKTFSQSSNLTTHKRIHSGDRPFRCTVCNKGFTESGNLRRHMRIHSGEKPFSCDICGKPFSQPSHVVKHKSTHFKIKAIKTKESNRRPKRKNISRSNSKSKVIDKCTKPKLMKKVKSKPRVPPLNVIKIRSPSGKIMYKCALCSRIFKGSGNLTRHLRIHTGEKPFSCSICSKTFSQATHVNKHMKTHQTNTPLTCEICLIKLENIESLFEHMKIHSSLNVEQDENLELVPAFMEDPSIITEEALDSGPIIYDKEKEPDIPLTEYAEPVFLNPLNENCNEVCNIKACSDVDSCSIPPCLDPSEPDTHCSLNTDLVKEDIQPFETTQSIAMIQSEVDENDICQKKLTPSRGSNKRKNLNRKPYNCQTCGKSFTESGNLSRHMRIHSGERPYKCTVCDKAFSQATHLHKHMNIHTMTMPYMCHLCKKSFKKELDLNKHMEDHVDMGSNKCHVCDKVFMKQSKLDSHLRSHSKPRVFQCTACDMSFPQSSLLYKHKKTHLGEKPFKCDLCGKGFSESGNMTRHLRVHTGEKPYSCKICGKAFSQASHVNKHMRIHPEAMSFSLKNDSGHFEELPCNPYPPGLNIMEDVIATPEEMNALGDDNLASHPERVLAPDNDISRYVRFFADSELCQCINCNQSFTVSQFTDHIASCLATNPNTTEGEVLDVRINESQTNKTTKEKCNVEMKTESSGFIDNTQTNVFGQCKSIFTESDHFSNVLNSYCSKQSNIHIKAEVK